MTKQDCKAARAVMEAWENGEEIECLYDDGRRDAMWCLCTGDQMAWDFSTFEYRIKPKPQTLYLNIYQDDKIGLGASVHRDKDEAIKMSTFHDFTKQLAIAAPITIEP